LNIEVSVDALPHRFTDQTNATVQQDEANGATGEPRKRFALAYQGIASDAESESYEDEPEGGQPQPHGDPWFGEILI
jgi:hypothetical protein